MKQHRHKAAAKAFIENHIVMLNHDTRLFPHHVDVQRRYDFGEAVAEITRHPTNPDLWGLKNLSGQKWVITTDEGAIKDVDPGRSASLMSGTRINFGVTTGEIRT